MSAATQILSRLDSGDPAAAAELLPLVYDELRKLAAARLSHEKPGQTLQATALVHEAFVRLVDGNVASNWQSRGHFFAAAAEAMRRILIDRARRKKTEKHGGSRQRLEMNDEFLIAMPSENLDELLALDEALNGLAVVDPDKATLVKLLYFAGLNLEEAGAALGISRATAHRQWTFVRAWLKDAIDGQSKETNEVPS